MANPNKIKNGGSGTKVGNFLRNTVLAPNNLSPYNTPKPQPSSAVPGAGYLGTSSGNQTMIPNASIAPKPGAVYSSGPYQNMTPVPQGPSLNGGMSPLPPSNTGRVYTSGPNQNISPLPQAIPTPIVQTSSPLGNRTSGSSGSYSGSSTGGGTPTGTGSLATPNGAATIGSTDFNYNKTPQQIAEEEALKRIQDYNDQQSQQDLNYENIMRDTLRQFQGEIDATNQVYADKLRQAGLQGQNRLGQQRAEDFNSGAVNSSFGNAARERVQSYNTDVEGGIQAQKLQSLAQIENSARELGNKYYEQKKAAKESGLAGYLENIKSAGAQKEAIATDIATNILNAGLTVDEISPAKLEKIAKDAGVPLQQIKTIFKATKDARDVAAAEAALKGQFNLSEGQARYDAQGNLIASRAKTYKGGSGGSGGSVSGGAGDLAITSQPGYSRLTAKQKSQADSIYNLTTAIEDYKNKINESGTKRGVNAFGADSALLQTKYNSIIFAAAQAEGTGALQAADRQVIEKIIPDVTRFGRNFTGPFKGGLKGVNLSLDDQISKYKNNLGTYGLTYKKPTGQTGSSIDTQSNVSNTLTSPDGTQEVDLSELTPAEVAEAKAAGWQ